MLSVISLPGFPVAVVPWEAQAGQRSLTVIVKATFTLGPGDLVPARAHDPLGEERHWDDSVSSSLHWPGDFAPSKRRVDVALVGHAYAPRGEPATSIVARLTVGDLTKAVRVTGDRAWTMGAGSKPEPAAPSPFVRIPLRYERAALSAENPVGIDVEAPPRIGAPARPNLERVRGEAGSPCFGPIAPTWRARRRLLDEAATFWAYGVARDPRANGPPAGPAPARFDFGFFNAAPADQQIDLLRPGTPLVLENLHATHERLETQVPALRPQVFRVPAPGGATGRVEEIILRCDSLWIDSDRGVLAMTWRGLTELAPDGEHLGTIVVAADRKGKKLRWSQVEKRLGERTSSTLRLGADGLPLPDDAEEAPPPDPLARRYDTVKASRTAAKEDAGAAPPSSADARIDPSNERTYEESTRKLAAPLRRPAAAPPAASSAASAPRQAPPAGGSTAPRASGHARRHGLALRKDLTLARCADIAAALAQKGADRAAVLRAGQLTEASWAVVEQHWRKVIAAEAEQGERTTADAFDEAFVRALEQRAERSLDLATYARLVVGVERGAVGRVLAELDLDLGALVRLQRVWAKRAGGSPELADALAGAVDGARRAGV